ncbi:Protein Hook 3 [Phytophthora boehmeriae]|uniref:Protein Hook 3 n=1 Tax=Phytophthora boehmeriae TaxID=109152 RepID=A0A8T1WN75_9STRA|nr:Protein Hook 3 [Phytophthora boehmeriae]
MEDETAADADANEAASLMRWLSFYAVQSQERRVSTVRGLLQTAFPDALIASSKTKDDWSDVVTTLESFYEVQLAIDTVKLSTAEDSSDETLRVVLELALGAVVQCEAKATFVRDILKMNDSVQTDLMAVIEKVMAREVPILKSDDAHQENAAKSQQGESAELFSGNEKEDVNETSNSDSRLYLSRNAALQRATRENDILKDENIHLARDLENAGKKLSDTEMANRELVSTIQQLREQLDVDVLRKERSLRALYDKQMHSLQHELDAAKVELRDKTVLTSEVSALRDEVDLLRPLAEKMTKVDSTVARYKAKIDELSGAKERLQRVEDTNAELVKKNLALETEITIAASWQRKLNEAKEENTVVEFRVSELQTLLAREREEHSLIRTELEIAQNSLKETSALNELRGAAEQQLSWVSAECNVFSALTMSGGISEFNPELMQKIARLEYENAELKKQIDGETSARIDTLLDEIEKLSRLKRSFEKKYFDTDRALQSTQHQLRRAKQQLASTITEFQVAVRLQTERQELENAVVVLEAKVILLEKERNHVSTQEQRKRGAKDEILRFSSQLNTQVSLMITELEKVLKENKELQTKCVKCNCSRGSPSRSEIVDSGQKAKKFYLRRIQQLEHEKETVEYKRREILLANAKLIQEQKQLHVKNVCLANEVSRLQESINHWLLRDERRKKKADLSRSQKNATVATCEEANPDEEVQRQQVENEGVTKRTRLLKLQQKSAHEKNLQTEAGSSQT